MTNKINGIYLIDFIGYFILIWPCLLKIAHKKTPAKSGGRAKCSQFLHIVSQRIFRLVPENLKKVVIGPFGNRKTEG